MPEGSDLHLVGVGAFVYSDNSQRVHAPFVAERKLAVRIVLYSIKHPLRGVSDESVRPRISSGASFFKHRARVLPSVEQLVG